LGELASNTAMAAIFLPIAGAAAIGLGYDPVAFALPVALAASVGFMLPVATPPNAIVFAYGAVTSQRMLRAGAPLDLIGVGVAVLAGMVLGPLVI
jgi:sodium-dependent dicarboxylate transporter 2/3/5